jgi:4,5-dihydroxyphthalate decarboxylase
VRIENNRSDRSLSQLLSAGEIDALIGARLPSGLDEDSNLARLFPDFREREKDYYLRTRVHPIMHLVVLKKDLHEAHPWLAPRLYAAFEAAKQKAWEELSFSRAQETMLLWLYADIAEIRTVFGHDPWPYGVEANCATLTTLLSYMHRQHFIARAPSPEEIFVPV